MVVLEVGSSSIKKPQGFGRIIYTFVVCVSLYRACCVSRAALVPWLNFPLALCTGPSGGVTATSVTHSEAGQVGTVPAMGCPAPLFRGDCAPSELTESCTGALRCDTQLLEEGQVMGPGLLWGSQQGGTAGV